MADIGKLLGERDVIVALIHDASGIIAIVLGKLFGFWSWVATEISKWLEHRRQATGTLRVPKKTVHVIAGTGLIPPMMSEHNANGRISTDCRTPLIITNLIDKIAIPTKVRVKIRGIERFRRAAYHFSLTGPTATAGESVPGRSTVEWWLIFQVFPPLPVSRKSLSVDIIVYDHLGNAHRTRNVLFTAGFPDAMPAEWAAQYKPISDSQSPSIIRDN